MLFLFKNELVISLHKLGNRHPLHPYKDFAARVNLTISHQRLPSSYCLTHKITHFIFRTLENWLFHANPGICRFRWKNLLCVWQQAQPCRQVSIKSSEKCIAKFQIIASHIVKAQVFIYLRKGWWCYWGWGGHSGQVDSCRVGASILHGFPESCEIHILNWVIPKIEKDTSL